MGEQQNYPPVLLSFSLHSKCLLNQQPAYLLVNGLGTFLLVDEPICLFGDFVLICKENLPLVRQNWISQRASCFVLGFFFLFEMNVNLGNTGQHLVCSADEHSVHLANEQCESGKSMYM